MGAKDIEVSYSTDNSFSGANFTIFDTITAIVGKNGSEKTTLIKCLTTLLIFDSGKISILRESVEQKNFNIIRSTISVCLNEGKNLYLNLTLIQNIEYF
ncbi:ATP-binding cassette domain-containing protein [Clostridium bowmanii]|uniref:ATP-binding cassette domain-containing protein n=1 Tax=Clostridium bowmanii TaxID=132925 RepID=UPI001C0E3736|nr:ATP-binding cassette domain-containing protein [Clostridium bowmanii]MBU3188250.1 ATP-binding cassette domain-containing protein [Clostridium bowmanii]MCA1072636.1 ATP-binding cassette domain-containing protein [Clostridium bowmanii]